MGHTGKQEGFTKVPNELYDRILSQRLSISQEMALLYVIRKTYGFNKVEDKISISMMAKEMGFCRRAMVNAVHDLQKMGILKCGDTKSGRPTYMMVREPKYWDTDI